MDLLEKECDADGDGVVDCGYNVQWSLIGTCRMMLSHEPLVAAATLSTTWRLSQRTRLRASLVASVIHGKVMTGPGR